MSKTEDEILERELSKAGGRRNLLLFGLGGLLATKLVERLQPTETYELTVGVPHNTNTVRATTSQILQRMGKLVNVGPEIKSDSLSAIVGARFIDTNPAIVHVQFNRTSETASQVVIRGLAKETLLWKQRSAQKAVEKVKARLLGEEV